MCRWVGHSKMKSINVDEFFDRKVDIDELESIFNENDKTEALVVAE